MCGASFGFRLTKSILCGILIHDKKGIFIQSENRKEGLYYHAGAEKT